MMDEEAEGLLRDRIANLERWSAAWKSAAKENRRSVQDLLNILDGNNEEITQLTLRLNQLSHLMEIKADIRDENVLHSIEPDWSINLRADCFIVSEYGDRAYYFCERDVSWSRLHGSNVVLPDMDDVMNRYVGVIFVQPVLGVDWRLTLRRRPER